MSGSGSEAALVELEQAGKRRDESPKEAWTVVQGEK